MKTKGSICFFLIIFSLLSLSSCALRNGIYRLLGIDSEDYTLQAVTGRIDLSSDDEDEAELIRTLVDEAEHLLCGEEIKCFKGRGDLGSSYYDSVLDCMAHKNYSKYSADGELFARLNEYYPELNVNTLIPAEDYENTLYRIFGGGTKVKHGSTYRYTYLEKINAYLLTGKQKEFNIKVAPISVEVTKDTYRMRASLMTDGTEGREYTIVYRMRQEKEPYIYALTEG